MHRKNRTNYPQKGTLKPAKVPQRPSRSRFDCTVCVDGRTCSASVLPFATIGGKARARLLVHDSSCRAGILREALREGSKLFQVAEATPFSVRSSRMQCNPDNMLPRCGLPIVFRIGERAGTASSGSDSEPTLLPEHCQRSQHGATSALRPRGEAFPTDP